MFTNEQVDYWQSLRDEMFANETFIKGRKADENQRHTAVIEMNDLLDEYLADNININDFRNIFQQKTASDWASFGLKGFSGAMFLNMLVNNIPNQHEIGEMLKIILPKPTDTDDGYQQLTKFMDYLRQILQSGVVQKRKIQPAHAPFFFSSWWHVQNQQEWCIYYTSARKALESEGVYSPSNSDPIDDYFTFREVFLTLAEKLDLTIWEMEHLCVWHQERNVQITAPVEPSTVNTETEVTPNHEQASKHTQIQFQLAKLGRQFSYDVWIASNDRKHTWNNESLEDYSIPQLPYFNGVGMKSQQMIQLIDVIWLKRSMIVAAFEIESTTSIFSGLLRMSDLTIALENFILPIYIAVPEERVNHVEAQLSRLTFQQLGLHERCRFFTFEKLLQDIEAMMSYATDVKAIDKISRQVGAITDEGF